MQQSLYALVVLILSVSIPGLAIAHKDGGIIVHDAWVREAPPNAKVLAAYMEIQNHAAQPSTLVHVSSSEFDKVEVHKTVHKDGMAQMIKQDHLIIPAEGKIELKSGGLHMMLVRPKKSLKAGDKISIVLVFANGSKIVTGVKVKKASKDNHGHSHNHESNHENKENKNHHDNIKSKNADDHSHSQH